MNRFKTFTPVIALARIIGFSYVAMDKNKSIWAYTNKPSKQRSKYWKDAGTQKLLGEYNGKYRNWKRSLRKVQ